ncbi:uncharacterized protein LOC141715023 [Apium graveolens]|uniref:uncharacterized protein LOC141715023 n=1 Tax=Apium graveolens TaxID=4045 RepID=UPI003D7A114E
MFIEDQIKKGNMNQYLQIRLNDKDKPSGGGKHVVNVIFGGTSSPPRSPDRDSHIMMIQPAEDETIHFSNADYEGLDLEHNQALVVTFDIAENEVQRILIDNGSSVNIVFEHTLNRMRLGHLRMDPCLEDPLYGFRNNMIPIRGVIYLPMVFGATPRQVSHVMKFYVISAASSYNMILGRPTISKLRAIPSTIHLKLKFPTPGGIGELRGDRGISGKCYGQALVMAENDPENRKKAMALPKGQSRKKHREYLSKRPRLDVNMIEDSGYGVTNADARIHKFVEVKERTKVEPAVQTMKVELEPGNPTRKLKIGKGLGTSFQKELILLLKEYANVFAWAPEDMPEIDQSVAMHSLDVDPRKRPIKQKRRNFAPERQQAIDEEIEKLLKANIICEIKYPDWLANVVLVKKPNGKWRMYVDYTSLNAACPKYSYPLPNIDQIIDATLGHTMLSFMDAFSGYNQVRMNPEHISKTAFITHRAVYTFIMMPFGLINAGATYQKMMNTIFKSQLGWNMESYVDGMISKSLTIPDHIKDLKECFDNLRRYNMKLNPQKCVFGVPSGKFLGFLVRERGIEANPEKINNIIEMKIPHTQKDIQKLDGCLAALRRFIPKLAEKCLPFFELLKGARNKRLVDWTPEFHTAYEEVKRHLMNPSVLSKAKPGEPLSLYIAAGPKVVSSALVREERGIQSPIYYVSQNLKDADTRYPNLEKFALALVHSSRKLRQYFQGREIRVVTDQQLKKIIHKPDASGRLVNWAIELSQFNIKFVSKTAIKAQALAEFVMECTFPEQQPPASHELTQEEANLGTDCWMLYMDGSSTTERCGAGLILISPEGFTIQQAITFAFKATNNQAEYEALISGLRLAKSLGISKMVVYNDSQIMVKQTNEAYIAKDPTLAQYQAMVRNILGTTPDITILQINREENSKAEELSKLVQNTSDLTSSVYFEELEAPSTERSEVLFISSPGYIVYLRDGMLPEDQNKARYLKHKAARFFLENGQLYRRTFSAPTLKCVDPDEANYCLWEVHEGICGDHLAAKALAYKVIMQRYYWPTIHADSIATLRNALSARSSTMFRDKAPACQHRYCLQSHLPFGA